jgi:predicted RNase H-like nuclease (RuvC/YqgF family)
MTVSIEQANAIIKELREVNNALQKENEFLRDELEELKFELSCEIDKEYDV